MRISPRRATLLFGFTLFVSAALLFSVQPMIAKLLLPVLGGTPNVWNTCMVFFQAVLLAGYGYAVIVSRRSFRQQLFLQLLLLAVALLTLPIGLSESWVNSVPSTGNPSLWLLACLAAVVGLPFFIVSSNAPLLQKWFAQTGITSGRDPYFLYSASNAGSLLALLSYPILLEPNLKLQSQSLMWTAGYVLLLLFVGLCGLVVWKSRQANEPTGAQDDPPAASFADGPVAETQHKNSLQRRQRLRWLLLAFVPSSLMLGVTNFISTDIASVPFLWVIPLSLYLLSFVFAFARRPLIPLSILVILLSLATIVIVISNLLDIPLNTKLIMLGHLIYFFLAALTCHQQLAQERPSTTHLTEFYFWLSFGGVLGGVFNALISPMLFNSVAEYPLVVLAACLLLPQQEQTQTPTARRLDYLIPAGILVLTLLTVLVFHSFGKAWNVRALLALVAPIVFLVRKRPTRFALSLAAIVLVGAIISSISQNTLLAERNFFGVLRVVEDPSEKIHWLFHGSTNHGRQSTNPEHKCEALSYFHRTGPIGQVFTSFRELPVVKNIAVIGLGTGATAVYAQPDDEWTFYEINPAVVDIARDAKYFSYLSQCATAPVNIVLGDARLKIQEAPEAGYGMIVLDAFSSDAIPIHLITQEALDLYLSKLAPGGLLVFHISNRHLNLYPVMANLAASRQLYGLGFYDPASFDLQGKDKSEWVVMARSERDTETLKNAPHTRVLQSDGRKVWTDDFSNILTVIKWR